MTDKLRDAAEKAITALLAQKPVAAAITRTEQWQRECEPAIAALRAALAEPQAEPRFVSVTKTDANNYCRILSVLGMEEEGDPVAEVERLIAQAEPDMRHPKIQRLIGAKARCEIELQLIEQLIDDPECDLTAMEMEYWGPLHDKLRAKLTNGLT